MAVVLDGPGSCSALHVDGLDAYLTQLTTSRYGDFGDHISSWDGVIRPLPGDAAAVAALRTATLPEIAEVMTEAADPQARQRLFDRWIGELVVPLSPAVDGLRLASVPEAAGARMLVLETPEPLPFSRDVWLNVTHRVTSIVDPPPDVPRSLLEFAADLIFTGDSVTGSVPDEVTTLIRRTRTLVHAVPVDRLPPRLVFRVFGVNVVPNPVGFTLQGRLIEERSTPLMLPGFPPRPLRVPADHIALLDATPRPLSPPLPLPVEHDETVEVDVLTNSAEDRVLLIPAGPLAPHSYTFRFGIDRARYRSPVVDDLTRYRAEAVLHVSL